MVSRMINSTPNSHKQTPILISRVPSLWSPIAYLASPIRAFLTAGGNLDESENLLGTGVSNSRHGDLGSDCAGKQPEILKSQPDRHLRRLGAWSRMVQHRREGFPGR